MTGTTRNRSHYSLISFIWWMSQKMDPMSQHQGIWLSQYEKPFSDHSISAPILLPTEPILSNPNGRCTDSHVGPLTFLQTICSPVSLCFAKLRPPSEVQIEPERGSVFDAVKNRQGEKKNPGLLSKMIMRTCPRNVYYFSECVPAELGEK